MSRAPVDRRRVLMGGCAIAVGLASRAWGAPSYPTKPVRLIVPFPPGQAADTYARLLAQRLALMWKQPVYVDNRPGGTGVVGMLAGKVAAADGYTLVMGTSSTLSINPILRPELPYVPLRDFAPVSNVVVQPLLFVVHPSFPPRSIQQLVAAAQKSANPLQYVSAGQGTAQHLTAELFASRAGIKLEHVAYKGSGPAMLDLLGGQVQLMMDSVTSALPHIKAGKIFALAVTTAQRVPQLPDVPSIAEVGYAGFEGVGWTGIVVPVRTPRELVDRISTDIGQVLNDPSVRDEIVARGGIPASSTPSGYAEFIRNETTKWAQVIKEAQIRLEE